MKFRISEDSGAFAIIDAADLDAADHQMIAARAAIAVDLTRDWISEQEIDA